jgi:hypothetical protein
MVKTVEVNSRMKYEAVVRNLERLDELRVKSISTEFDGSTKVIFRERTLGEFFKENLPWNKTLAIESRQGVLDAFKPLIKNELHSEQLFQNIKDRVDHNFGLTGYALKCDYQPVLESRRPSPLQGGTVAAISKGNSIQLVEADPAKIKCSHAVLRTSSAIVEALQHPKLTEILKRLYSSGTVEYQYLDKKSTPRSQLTPPKLTFETFKDGDTTKSWCCVADLKLPDISSNEVTIPSDDLKDLIRRAVGEKSGSVVIEVMHDHLEEHHLVSTYSYTNPGLAAQIKAASDMVSKAKEKNKDLVITFACKDKSVLERMSAME